MQQIRHVSAAVGAGTLVVLCGGMSDEHEVSLASARSVIGAIGGRRSVRPVVITRRGTLLSDRASRALLDGARDPVGDADERDLASLELAPEDVVFPLLHGPFGEDGSVQGWLRMLGIAHVGSGVHASAVGMDKLSMKAVFASNALPQVAYRGLTWRRYQPAPDAMVASLASLGFPLFVKPANLGSSVGIHKAADEPALRDALDDAFRYDRRVIVEAAVREVRELEVAVLGNDDPQVSPVGEIRYDGAFYDYHAKYTPGAAHLLIPAPIPAAVAERALRLARAAFEAIDAAGLARVDLFYEASADRLLVNEINTMPGFTATSMYPRLWAAAGIAYDDLVERLVTLALTRCAT
ncbi:MAG: D-alanine--D-alanine ligase [Trueperaceae bacterium]|nr:MAG: D-alanine--D-alanine ligase [Trueperaceae bacterium]